MRLLFYDNICVEPVDDNFDYVSNNPLAVIATGRGQSKVTLTPALLVIRKYL